MNSDREAQFREISRKQWDLIVIGGGITGAGIMREAVRRNLKTLLVEQRDFAWGSSSRSGQLVHGGLRYLGQGNIRLTYESVRERGRLLRELPGLVNVHNMMMAAYKGGLLQTAIVRAALLVYDIMSRDLKKHIYPVAHVADCAPHIRTNLLACGLLFNESLTDDARLVFRVLSQATQEGGVALNYCRAVKLLRHNGRVAGVTLEDGIGGETQAVHAKQVINATGAWADRLRSGLANRNRNHMRPLRGSHLVFSADRLPVTHAVVITHPQSKRPGFALPWQGRVIVGNTDIDHTGEMDEAAAITAQEVDYLLENVRHHFPGLGIDRSDVIATFSGVRPVIDSGKKDPSAESREHAVWQEDGLLTVTGGKLTTFRLLALDALEATRKTLGPLPAIDPAAPFFTPIPADDAPAAELSREQWARLQGRYGHRAADLVAGAAAGELAVIPDTHTLWAELRWAAGHEAVVHLEDLLLRRTRIGLLLAGGGMAYLPRIREICQPVLGWDDPQWEDEARNYLDTWRRCHSVP